MVGKVKSILIGNKIKLKFPSVGATQNILMASVLAKGQTIIENAAMEPEIKDLGDFLISIGAKIKGHGSSKIYIQGVKAYMNQIIKLYLIAL